MRPWLDLEPVQRSDNNNNSSSSSNNSNDDDIRNKMGLAISITKPIANGVSPQGRVPGQETPAGEREREASRRHSVSSTSTRQGRPVSTECYANEPALTNGRPRSVSKAVASVFLFDRTIKASLEAP